MVEEQAHRVQVAALAQMQLQVMERVEEQERELRRLNALLVEHQEVLKSSTVRPQQETPQPLLPRELGQLRCEVEDILPGMVNTVGACSRAGQVSDLGRLPIVRRDAFEDILVDAEDEVPHTPQRWVWFAECGNFYTYTKTCGTSGGEDQTFRSISGALPEIRPYR